MCLHPNQTQETKFKAKVKKGLKSFIGYKVVETILNNEAEIVTPYQRTKVYAGWFKSDLTPNWAKDKINNFKNSKYYSFSYNPPTGGRVGSISQGIHFYRTRQQARLMASSEKAILRCTVLAKDVLGLGHKDVVATKIWVPKAELDKAKRKA